MRAPRLLVALLGLLAAGPAATAGDSAGPLHRADPAYRAELQARAVSMQLADAPAWHALLHYREGRFGGVRSRADDAKFFLAPEGARDPAAELAATLAAFFEPPPADPDAEPAQCRFVARAQWLDEQLGFDPQRLPRAECTQFREWFANFEPDRLTLVFPEAFINNPASMFGHTLLRVDAPGPAAQSDLLAWAINFAALTDGEQGARFAVKGILGLYPGQFSIAPYYAKVEEYGDWESRDIWEYQLDFERAEIERMLAHLWELRDVRFDYFFFDENCSYQLLDLLEVGRPGLRLIRGNPIYLIPADSVRSVQREAELVAAVRWRPSAASRLRYAAHQLPPPRQRDALRIARGELDPEAPELAALPAPERAAVLSVAYDYLRHDYLARRQPPDEARARAHRVLLARSRVAVVGEPAGEPPAPAVRPDQGHDTGRFALGGGWWNDRAYVELRLRPAFHHLLDPEGGYTRGAQIEFLDGALRWYPESNELRLHELVLLDILSLAPRDRFFRPLSWSFDTGLRTRLVPDDDDDLDPAWVYRTRGGAGLAFEAAGGLLYASAHAQGDAGPELEQGFALGYGGGAGWRVATAGDLWSGHAFAEITHFPVGDETMLASLGLEQRLRLSRNHALEARTSWEHGFGASWIHAGLRLNLFW